MHLLDKLLDIEPIWESMRTSLVVLNNYAVAFRYSGEVADRETAKDAVKICSTIRDQVRRSFEQD